MPQGLDGKTYYSIPEVAAHMGVDKTSVQKYIETGAMKARLVKTGSRPAWHMTAQDVQDFYDRRKAKQKLKEQVKKFTL